MSVGVNLEGSSNRIVEAHGSHRSGQDVWPFWLTQAGRRNFVSNALVSGTGRARTGLAVPGNLTGRAKTLHEGGLAMLLRKIAGHKAPLPTVCPRAATINCKTLTRPV